MTDNKKTRVPVYKLKKAIMALLGYYGISLEDAEIIANSFIHADVCGVNTHGVTVIPAHLEKLKKGGYNVKPNIHITREGTSFAVVDGDGSMGPLSANYSMKLAIKEAKEKGAFCVFSYNNNTLGPAFHYSSMATDEEMIGIVMCNTPPAMAPWKGKDKLFGTNPISIAIPRKERNPIVLDMATSQVAKSKLNIALKEGKEIPLGWATDTEGNPTTDPRKGIEGMMMPMGGYKGYGIAMMVDIISGVLSGAGFLRNVGSFYRSIDRCMNVGYMFLVLNPRMIFGEEFYGVMDEYYKIVKTSNSINEVEEIHVPGDRKNALKKINLDIGVEISKDTIRKLNSYLFENKIGLTL